MKVVIINCVFIPEPVVSARIGSELAAFLSKENYDVSVICPEPTRPFGYDFSHTPEQVNQAYRLYRVNSYTHPGPGLLGRMKESYSFGIEVVKLLKQQQKPDLIYMNSWPMFSQYIIARYAFKKQIPLITHVQDVYPESFLLKMPAVLRLPFKFLTWIDKFVLRNSAYVIAISENMKSYLTAGRNLEPSKVVCIPNWLPQNSREQQIVSSHELPPVLADSSFKILYFGNIGPVAGLDTILPVFRSLASYPVKLIVAGSGVEKKRLQEMKAGLELTNVEFMEVPQDMSDLLLSNVQVCLLPIRHGHDVSSLPSKLLSYVNAGKPVLAVTGKESEIAKFINNADCGWVLDSATLDEQKLKNQVALIAGLPESELMAKGNNAKAFAEEHFSAMSNLLKLKKMINESINRIRP